MEKPRLHRLCNVGGLRKREWTGRRGLPWFTLLFVPALLVIASLVVTCVVLLRFSFNRWDPVEMTVPDWTLANYIALFTNHVEARAFITTLRISLIVTSVCLVIGYPVAYGIATARRYRRVLTFLLITPMLMDVLVRAFGWVVLLGTGGLVEVLMTHLGIWLRPHQILYTDVSVMLELIHELIPFMVLPIANVVERIDPRLTEAAMNLRAGPIRAFFHVLLPLSIPGILAGTFLTFALAMSAFVAPLILGGGNVVTMTIIMSQSMLTTLDWPSGAAQAVVLVTIVVGLLAINRYILQTRAIRK
jgi:putative spermidine/putrescine transport system permease protein